MTDGDCGNVIRWLFIGAWEQGSPVPKHWFDEVEPASSGPFRAKEFGLLQDKLFEKVPTVVLTSATLSSAGNFNFIRKRLGLDQVGPADERGIVGHLLHIDSAELAQHQAIADELLRGS